MTTYEYLYRKMYGIPPTSPDYPDPAAQPLCVMQYEVLCDTIYRKMLRGIDPDKEPLEVVKEPETFAGITDEEHEADVELLLSGQLEEALFGASDD